MNYEELIKEQRAFFNNRTTGDISFRKQSLTALQKAIRKYEKELSEALRKDLGKAPFESYMTEIGFILSEIRHTLKHLDKWAAAKRCKTPLFLFGSTSHTRPEPYGIVLILSPWNYPVQLLLAPLVGAIAAGNCAILKPSPRTVHTNHILGKLISETFPPQYIAFLETDNRQTDNLLKQHFDYIFYTGGVAFGKRIMMAAAKNLTPVTLELGGKSPCIVDNDAHIQIAARRIVWGKYLNCGQTCVAPDYIFVHREVKDKLITALQAEIERQYGKSPQESPDYPRIISQDHFYNLLLLLKQGHIVAGGKYDDKDLYIAPTVISGILPENRIMSEEIFGPILPLLDFDDIDNVIDYVNNQEKPLALYYFGQNKKKARYVLQNTSSGGACINDVVTHVANTHLPFGGVGSSGTGAYHGKYSFDTFSHTRSIVQSTTRFNIGMKFAPYDGKLKWLKKIMK
ncbi:MULTISPECIES: aldehyde dehydrogenase [Bacteroidales]|jgi:aldehyde dehydrogenase family protein|uniref:aldehyde dehydrogenase n=1 Tax=Bacteroidales TaxID=171549 RepID=UPI000574CECC|nr:MULTISPECIES: aldehyde dehydrogenase [Bacteroidales]KHM46936.1 aldehyde dehydrogenase [Coprobacter secundus]